VTGYCSFIKRKKYIYYIAFLSGNRYKSNISMMPFCELTKVEQGSNGFALEFKHRREQCFSHGTDIVILVTGYRHEIPSFINGIRQNQLDRKLLI